MANENLHFHRHTNFLVKLQCFIFFSGPQLNVDSDDEDTPFEDSDNDDSHSDEDNIGQAHDMFSRIFRIRIYDFFLPNICFEFLQMLKTEKNQ